MLPKVPVLPLPLVIYSCFKMRESELFMFAVLLAFVSGQEQYLREVTNPTGPSQIILRGGFLGGSSNGGQGQQQQQPNPATLSQSQQALPLQVTLDSPVGDDGNVQQNFRFAETSPEIAPQSVQQNQQTVFQQPQLNQGSFFQEQQQYQTPISQPVFNQQQYQSPFNTPSFNQQQQFQAPVNAPTFNQQQQFQAPVNAPTFNQQQQQYANINGNSVSYVPLGIQNQIQSPSKPHAVQKHALVDQYGRKLAEYESQAPIPVQQRQQVFQTQPATAQQVGISMVVPTQKHALVDQYGRKLAEFESPQQTVQIDQKVRQQTLAPAAQNVYPVIQQPHYFPAVNHVYHPQPVTHVQGFPLVQQQIDEKQVVQNHHIFNVLHGSEPLIFQDVCTTDPSQKNMRACVLKQPARHPVPQTVKFESQSESEQPTLGGGASTVFSSHSQVVVTTSTESTVTSQSTQDPS